MSLERDPVLDGVLREARAAASPGAGDLAQALSGIRQRILAAPILLHDVPDAAFPDAAFPDTGFPDAALPDAAVAGSGTRPSGNLASAKWAAQLRRLLGTAVTLGVGFAIGVQYARQIPAPSVVLPGAAPIGSATSQPPLAQPLVAEALLAPAPAGAFVDGTPSGVEAPSASGRRANVHARVAARRSPAPPARGSEALATEGLESLAAEKLSFAQVLERLERAQRAARDLEPELSLRLLDELDTSSDALTLRDERLVTRVLAACDVGDAAAAQRAARELSNADPASVYTSRISNSCAAATAKPSPR